MDKSNQTVEDDNKCLLTANDLKSFCVTINDGSENKSSNILPFDLNALKDCMVNFCSNNEKLQSLIPQNQQGNPANKASSSNYPQNQQGNPANQQGYPANQASSLNYPQNQQGNPQNQVGSVAYPQNQPGNPSNQQDNPSNQASSSNYPQNQVGSVAYPQNQPGNPSNQQDNPSNQASSLNYPQNQQGYPANQASSLNYPQNQQGNPQNQVGSVAYPQNQPGNSSNKQGNPSNQQDNPSNQAGNANYPQNQQGNPANQALNQMTKTVGNTAGNPNGININFFNVSLSDFCQIPEKNQSDKLIEEPVKDESYNGDVSCLLTKVSDKLSKLDKDCVPSVCPVPSKTAASCDLKAQNCVPQNCIPQKCTPPSKSSHCRQHPNAVNIPNVGCLECLSSSGNVQVISSGSSKGKVKAYEFNF